MPQLTFVNHQHTRHCYNKYMATYSFDIVSEYDKAEMNNVFAAVEREISNRYDFKDTPAAVEWLTDKAGFKAIGSNDWQVNSIIDIIRKHLANRGQSSKVLDLDKHPVETNLKTSQDIPFKQGLDQEKSKMISKLIRDQLPKLKTSIQGDVVRVQSGSKDDLQKAMQVIRNYDLDFPVNFINYR